MSRLRSAFAFACSVALLLWALPAHGQCDLERVLDEADRFYDLENFEAGATEYQRFLFLADDHPSVYYAFYQLGTAELRLGRGAKAVPAFRQAARLAPSALDRSHIAYRLALAYLHAHDLDRAKVELLRITAGSQDRALATQASLLTGVAFAYQERWDQAHELFERARVLQQGNTAFEASLGEATGLLAHLAEAPAPKSPERARWMSTVVPGSGQLYAGQVRQGLTTLAVNAGTSYLVYRSLTQKAYVDATLLASMLWWRYYQGNRERAETAALEVNERYRRDLQHQLFATLEEASRHLDSAAYAPERTAGVLPAACAP